MSTICCSNPQCQSANVLEDTVCHACGTPLLRRYLWALGDWVKAYKLEELVEERYLQVQPRVFLDTQPAQKPLTPEEIPDKIQLYLKLFPARLHVPQLHSYLPSPDPEMDLNIWFLEYGSLPLDERGELRYPELLPRLQEVWPNASDLQQLTWLWQMARLWQPFQASGVVSSLLDNSLLRVNGFNVQLLELRLDEHQYHGVKELADIWSEWFKHCQPTIADFGQELLSRLSQGKIPHAEYLAALLEKAITAIAEQYEFNYQIQTATDKGPTRDHNEDYCYPLATIQVSFPEIEELEEESVVEESVVEEGVLAETQPQHSELIPTEAIAVVEIEPNASEENLENLQENLESQSSQALNTANLYSVQAVSVELEATVPDEAVISENTDLPVPETAIAEKSELPSNLPLPESLTTTEDVLFAIEAEETENNFSTEEAEADIPTTPSPSNKRASVKLIETTKTASVLTIICDGVGGQDAGEVASQLTVNSLVQVINARLPEGQRGDAQQVLPQLNRCISDVNERVNYRNDQEKRSERGRMGTTLVMLMSDKHQAYLGNVGDSRCYWITPDSCQQVTVDDDLASREVRLGYIFYREAIHIPRSGALVQAMGLAPSINLHPALARLFVPGNSLFLLCSDGLCDFERVEQYWPSELLPILDGSTDLATGSDRLINLANTKNGHDNVTISLVRVEVSPLAAGMRNLDYETLAGQLPEMLPPPIAPVITTPKTATKGSLLTSDLSEVASTLTEVFNTPIDFRPSNRKFWIGLGIGVVIWGAMVYQMGRWLSPPPEAPVEIVTPAPSNPAPNAAIPTPPITNTVPDANIPSPPTASPPSEVAPTPIAPPPLAPSP